MKTKLFFLSMLAVATLAACSDDDDEPVACRQVVTFDEPAWDALIDNPQYMGPKLYGDGTYAWTDAATTLSSALTNDYGDGMFWGGGIAISNYINDDVAAADLNCQLAVPVSNGSRNFAVVSTHAFMEFKDAQPRTIYALDLAPTSYLLRVETYGNDFARALTAADDYFRVVVTGYNGQAKTASQQLYLTRDGVAQQTWQNASLESLGKVTKIEFTFEGSDASEWGVNTPTYVAVDNIDVEKLQ